MNEPRTIPRARCAALLAALTFLAGGTVASAPPSQAAGRDVPQAENTTVTLTTGLGVTKTVSVNGINDDDLVLKDLLGYWNIDQANFVVQTEKGVYTVVPLDVFRSAETTAGKTVVRLSNGETLQGNLVGTLAEGPTATYMQQPANVYPLEDCVKIELLTLDSAYVKYHAENLARASSNPSSSRWSVFLQDRSAPSFQLANLRLVYKYYSTAGYIIGGQNRVKETGAFQVRVADKNHMINIEDFREVAFSLRSGSSENVSLESNTGIKTTGTIAITDQNRGDLYLLGELIGNPRLKVAIRMAQCRLRHEN